VGLPLHRKRRFRHPHFGGRSSSPYLSYTPPLWEFSPWPSRACAFYALNIHIVRAEITPKMPITIHCEAGLRVS
jgi:hypothetical protein